LSDFKKIQDRTQSFSAEFDLRVPILLAPMAGACPPSLSIEVTAGGGMGACGVLMMTADQIAKWVSDMRKGSNSAFQLNTWIPDPDPIRDRNNETKIQKYLEKWGPKASRVAADNPIPNFSQQCEAMLSENPAVISSIMGLYPPKFVSQLKAKKIKWFATVTTVAEAIQAEQAGADVIVAQGMEAGGHRGAFQASEAQSNMVGLFSLLPSIYDAVKTPIVATGGISDSRGIAAAFILGASAVQIGTGFLRSPEAGIPRAWSDAIGSANPENTVTSRVFSGRLGRSVRNKYTNSATSSHAPNPAPYPIQRKLTQAMRDDSIKSNNLDGMQAWTGQSAKLALDIPAKEIVIKLWDGVQTILD
jgi:nitronate monooxygenase